MSVEQFVAVTNRGKIISTGGQNDPTSVHGFDVHRSRLDCSLSFRDRQRFTFGRGLFADERVFLIICDVYWTFEDFLDRRSTGDSHVLRETRRTSRTSSDVELRNLRHGNSSESYAGCSRSGFSRLVLILRLLLSVISPIFFLNNFSRGTLDTSV